MRVERSKEFVTRVKDTGARGIDCITFYKKAHALVARFNLKEHVLRTTMHVLDQCFARGVPTNFEKLLAEDGWVVTSGGTNLIEGRRSFYGKIVGKDYTFPFVINEQEDYIYLVTGYRNIQDDIVVQF